MSGGSMDYVCFRIQQAAEDVASEIVRIEREMYEKGYGSFKVFDYYKDKYPDNPDLKDGKPLAEAVLKRLRSALKSLKEAAVYAERVEWLTSGDDGYESFVVRTDEDLREISGGEGNGNA